MKHPDIHTIAKQLNLKAHLHPFGMLQRIRANLKGLSRQPGKNIFSFQTTKDHYAFHHGGRTELQFNIGLEDGKLRYGVAFSFERSQTLQRPIKVLGPKVKRFNEFIQQHSGFYKDMQMWHYDKKRGRSPSYKLGPIRQKLSEDMFIFLGKQQRGDRIDYEVILTDFDRLLQLYQFVEGGGKSQPGKRSLAPYVFCPGFSKKKSSATATQMRKQHDVDLIHNRLQEALCRRLASRYGAKNVGDEQQIGKGAKVDVVVRWRKAYLFYEIKTANSPRACIREAIGQLLEYAFWPPAKEVMRLIVVGKRAIDKDGREYLRCLSEGFFLPIEYEQIDV